MIDHVEAPRAWAHLTKILWEIKQAREPESIGNKFTAESEGGTALYRPANLFSSPATGFNTAFRTGFKSQVSSQECPNNVSHTHSDVRALLAWQPYCMLGHARFRFCIVRFSGPIHGRSAHN